MCFPLAGKSSLNKTMFHIARKSDSTSRNGEFVQKYVSIRQKNCQEYQRKIKEWLPILVVQINLILVYTSKKVNSE